MSDCIFTKVYRYEIPTSDKVGIGPYHAYSRLTKKNIKLGLTKTEYLSLSLDLNEAHTDKFPGLRKDFKGIIADENLKYYYTGCVSNKELKKWFYGFNRILKSYGFKVVEYTVKRLLVGNSSKQVVFSKRDVVKKIIL